MSYNWVATCDHIYEVDGVIYESWLYTLRWNFAVITYLSRRYRRYSPELKQRAEEERQTISKMPSPFQWLYLGGTKPDPCIDDVPLTCEEFAAAIGLQDPLTHERVRAYLVEKGLNVSLRCFDSLQRSLARYAREDAKHGKAS